MISKCGRCYILSVIQCCVDCINCNLNCSISNFSFFPLVFQNVFICSLYMIMFQVQELDDTKRKNLFD